MRIGIDLGGTTIKGGIVDEQGSIRITEAIPTGAERESLQVIDDIIVLIENLIKKSEISADDIETIGFGVPGLVDYEAGEVIYCTNLSWYNVPLGSKIKEYFNKPVYIENDATVAAYAESLFGSTKGVRSSVFLTLGTGIGGGIIIDNSIVRGSHFAGSEIGHMIIGENFYDCNCGNNGCFETLASATSVIRYAKHLIQQGRETTIMKAVNDNIENINAGIVFDAAKAGDRLANEVVDRMIRYLAIGIINIYNMVDPDMITLGGGVSKAGNFLLEKLNGEISRRIFCKEIKYGDIVLATLGNDAGIIGAAFLGKN